MWNVHELRTFLAITDWTCSLSVDTGEVLTEVHTGLHTEVHTEVHIVRAIRHIGMDEAAHDPTMMKEKDAWHLCAITVECTRMMTSEQRGESPPPHAKSRK